MRTGARIVPSDAGKIAAREAGQRFLAVAEPEQRVGQRDMRFVQRDGIAAVLRALQHVLRRRARVLELQRGELCRPDAELDHRDFARIAESFADRERGRIARGRFGMQPAVHAPQAHAKQTIRIELQTPHVLLAIRLQRFQTAAQKRRGFRETGIVDERIRARQIGARVPMMLLARLEPTFDGLSPDPEQDGRRALVAAAAFERAVDEQIFRGRELVAAFELQKHVGEIRTRDALGLLVGEKRRECVGIDRRAFREHAQLADEIAQLADVPGHGCAQSCLIAAERRIRACAVVRRSA